MTKNAMFAMTFARWRRKVRLRASVAGVARPRIEPEAGDAQAVAVEAAPVVKRAAKNPGLKPAVSMSTWSRALKPGVG